MKDGGPAFPMSRTLLRGTMESREIEVRGMSLRDWFAGKALPSAMSIALDNARHGVVTSDENIARDCYSIANAMLKEREK